MTLKDCPSIEERTRAVNLIMDEAGKLVGGLGFALDYTLEESVEGVDMIEAIDGVFDLQIVSTCVLAMFGVPVDLSGILEELNPEKSEA